MRHITSSRFSISSRKFDASFLSERFPWRVVEDVPAGQVDFNVIVFDLGIGQHDRVDDHLVAGKIELLKHESELGSLYGDCDYALWVRYQFPAKDGAINIGHSLSAAFSLLRVELIFHLSPHDT